MPTCDHAAFRVADLEASIAFYTAMLPGEVVKRKHGQDFYRTEIAYVAPRGQDDFVIVLIQPTRIRWVLKLGHKLMPRQFRSSEHLGFACASRDEVLDRERLAKQRGERINDGPKDLDGGQGFVFEVLDPDGNAVEWTHNKKLR
jgi:lactoylglutathione lyase